MTTSSIYCCLTCRVLYAVPSDDPDLRLLERPVPCPNYPCRGELSPFAETNADIRAVKVTALELFQAHQLGLASERRCGPEDLQKLLIGATIVGIDVAQATDPNKSIFRSITLQNGKVVHFGPSTFGAVALKVTENNDGR